MNYTQLNVYIKKATMKTFSKSFTQQEPIPKESINAALEVMKSGRLHRYNAVEGAHTETELLEQEFAQSLGVPYCLACSSGGYALHIAMRAAGVKQGDKVLCNAFTLAPVPGAIHNSGAVPVLVEMAEDYCIDLDDLDAKAKSSNARFFMLSHMRGHIADMDRIVDICKKYDLILIEDCAHTMGASWYGKASGTFGDIACFSTQTYKHLNSGEGGFLTTHDDAIMAKAIIYSGSYMLFERHLAAPPKQAFDQLKYETPNYSGRMDNLRAAILRPQLKELTSQCERWNKRYSVLEKALVKSESIYLPKRDAKEQFVASSIQFSLPTFTEDQIINVIENCAHHGVILKWFGGAEPTGYTSRYDSWKYIDEIPTLEKTEKLLSKLLDMRIPLTFSLKDCELIAEIIVTAVNAINNKS